MDRRTPPAVAINATITRGFAVDRLTDIEKSWESERTSLAASLQAAGQPIENAHWDWRNKVQFYPPGWHCFAAIECESEVQGLMAVETRLRPSRLNPGQGIAYVDFLEAAPWNRREPVDRSINAVQEPRFGGVGTLLIAEAIRMNLGQTTSGRIGLHSLPDAEDFYSNRCRMVRIGPDDEYHGLVYFEYPDGVVASWLTSVGLSA